MLKVIPDTSYERLTSCFDTSDERDALNMFYPDDNPFILEVHENLNDVVVGQSISIGKNVATADCPINFWIQVKGM